MWVWALVGSLGLLVLGGFGLFVLGGWVTGSFSMWEKV